MMRVALFLVFVGGCLGATTVEMLSADNRFSTLVSLVQQAGLVDTLNKGTYTIFAPTNAAFSKVPAATLTSLQNNVTALTNVLTYHVVPGSIMSSAASNELKVTTANGADARFNVYSHNNVVTIQGSTISEFDKVASNGVIHVVDSVMMPPSGDIVDYVSGNSKLSTLLSLVVQAGLASALQGDALTLFAPTNAAFAKLSQAQLTDIQNDSALLASILKFHVVGSTEYSVGLWKKEHLTTLNGGIDDLTVHMPHHNTAIKLQNALVTMADIGTTNGVVHLIDHVLVPHHGTAFGR